MYAKKCLGHYKHLEVTYIASTDELLLLWIRSCKSTVKPIVKGTVMQII